MPWLFVLDVEDVKVVAPSFPVIHKHKDNDVNTVCDDVERAMPDTEESNQIMVDKQAFFIHWELLGN